MKKGTGVFMGKIRDSERTRRRILDAAAAEFGARGYDAVTVAAVARRAKLSKQLVHHHFGSKARLFEALHATRFRPRLEDREALPAEPAELFSDRFDRHAGDADYVRFQTWEAARGRTHDLPGESARRRRIAHYGAAVRRMQKKSGLAGDLDPRFIQLAAYALTTYPMAFGQITRLVTGRASSDPEFRRQWRKFLRALGERLFSAAKR